MKKANDLKKLYLASPANTFFFVDYLKELNKAGQKDLVKMEVDKYKRDIEAHNLSDYMKIQSQYEIAEKGRYRKYKFPLFSTLFFIYLG